MASPLEGLCLFNGLTSVIAVWILVEEQGPERSGHVAAWDARSQQFLIHGGSDTEFRPDLWAYDVESGPWDQKLQLNSAPSKRGDHVAVWDPSELALWIHGGFDGATLFNDLWRYSDNRWTLMADGAGLAPCARSSHVAVWDASRSAMWLHGVLSSDLQSDLWMFDYRGSLSSWVQIPGGNGPLPAARAHHVAAWDDTNAAMWIHGGYANGRPLQAKQACSTKVAKAVPDEQRLHQILQPNSDGLQPTSGDLQPNLNAYDMCVCKGGVGR